MVYRHSEYLAGLDETVTFVKNPERVYVIRADGREDAFPERVRAEDRQAWVQRHGRLSPALVQELQTSSEAALPISIIFDANVDWTAIGKGLRSADESARANARNTLRTAIQKRGTGLLPSWQAAGFVLKSLSAEMPVAYGEATSAAIQQLGRLDNVTEILSAKQGRLVTLAAPSSVSDPKIDTTFNPTFYGATQNVGYLELPNCGIYDEHEAFSNGSVTHSDPLRTCGSDNECQTNICASSHARCVDVGGGPHCVGDHMTAVSSCMLAYKEGAPWGAAKAHLFVYNAPVSACSPSGTDAAYTWFDSNGVETVPESWACYNSPNADGMVQDHWARVGGISIFKSAGNQVLGPEEEACPYTLNSLCVGAATAGGLTMASFSSWVNPNATGSDREEPDLTALGVDVDAAMWTGKHDWALWAGTSFSAPAVADLAALLKDACGVKLKRNPLAIRAILQNSGWFRNPDADWRYTTPNGVIDGKDGAGGVEAAIAMSQCGYTDPDGPTVGFQNFDIDLTAGTNPPPGDPPDISGPPPGGLSHTPPATGQPWQRLVSLGTLPKGTRVRATLVWNSCPPTVYAGATAPSQVATDFDLFLNDTTNHHYDYASQSVSDNSEGFDVTVAVDGDRELWIRWPTGNLGCGDPKDEPVAIAWSAQTP